MSEKYSSEFKAKVALDAVAQGRSVIEEIAKKHGVTEDEVIAWAGHFQDEAAMNVLDAADTSSTHSHAKVPEGEDVDITTNDDVFAEAISHGVMSDTLNYKKLIFWSTLGTSIVIIFVIGLVYFSQYSLFETQKNVSANSTYSEVSELKAQQDEVLNTFGVVNLEEGIYRIPIDSAINKIVAE